MNFNLKFMYDDMTDTGAVISNYKPPTPAKMRTGNKALNGYTIFNDNISSDTLIKFSAVFEAHSKEQIEKIKLFRKNYFKRFIFIDEFGTEYRGYLQGNFDIDTPIEGDIYYISCELLCPCSICGWEGENSEL